MRICFTSKCDGCAFHIYNSKRDMLKSFELPKHVTGISYGVSWDNDNLYIGNKGKVLIYDRNYKFKELIVDDASHGTHQVLCYQNKLFCMQTNQNVIRIQNVISGKVSHFDLVERKRTKTLVDNDKHHFNSVLIKNNKMYVSAHNLNKPSFVDVYTYPDFTYLETISNVGYKVHGLAIKDKILYTADSVGSRRIVAVNSDGFFKIGANRRHFVKGFALGDNDLWAGYSRFYENHKKRILADAVLVHRHKNNIVKKVLPKFGQINEIRILDEYDYAHGIEPFM